MKRIIVSLACLLTGFAWMANAQLLWKVSGNGLKAPSYIFGTHHVAPPSVVDSVPGLSEALANADIVYGEMDMSGDMSAMQGAVMRNALSPADSTLTRIYTNAQLDSINIVLKEYMGAGADVRMMETMKPAMLTTLITMMQTQKVMPGFSPEQQIDRIVQMRALKDGKEVRGFETAGEQALMLLGEPIADQAEQLMDVVRRNDDAEESARELAKAYLAGDLAKLQSMMEEEREGMGGMAERLIYQRNEKWAETLAAQLAEGSLFIAVGAGHLPGDRGLLELLKAKGYTVEGVKP